MQRTAWFALSLVLAFATCSGNAAAPAKPDGVYRVRGQVVAFDGSGENARTTIAHEAIPDFKNRSGTRAGMPAMTMAFGIAAGVETKALVPGSKWALVIEVVWSREPVLRIIAAKPLSAAAKLALATGGR